MRGSPEGNVFICGLGRSKTETLLLRDRFGIKPFYYVVVDGVFYFASEAKALLPVLPDIETDPEAMAEYLTFNFVIGENTLFKGVKQLLPGHGLAIEGGELRIWRYWDGIIKWIGITGMNGFKISFAHCSMIRLTFTLDRTSPWGLTCRQDRLEPDGYSCRRKRCPKPGDLPWSIS